MHFIVLIGRIFFSAYFILASIGNFSPDTMRMAAQQGMPMANVLVPLFGVMALLGGLSVLLGLKARWGVWLLVILLFIVTFFMHPFWKYDGDMMMMQRAMFLTSLSMLGSCLIIAYFGSGPFSLDNHHWMHRFRR